MTCCWNKRRFNGRCTRGCSGGGSGTRLKGGGGDIGAPSRRGCERGSESVEVKGGSC